MEEFKPQPIFMIQDLETLRIIADPLRAQIYELLIPEAANIKQVAERLGTAPSRLYYHINLMEKAGLIQVSETRMVANLLEKYYRAAAYDLEIAEDLFNFSTHEGLDAMNQVLLHSLDATREDLQRSIQARLQALEQGADPKERHVMVNRMTARVPDAYAEEFRERLAALVREFAGRDTPPDQEGGESYQNYALTIAFYPSFYYKAS